MSTTSDDPNPASFDDPLDLEPRPGHSVSLNLAASLLNVSRRTVYNWIREGQLSTVRVDGSQRVLVESLYAAGFQPLACSTSAAAATFDVLPLTR